MRPVPTSLSLAATLALALFSIPTATAQINPLETEGIVPWASYHHGDIDSVNLVNGAVTFHIPLYSLPQRGGLNLSFSIAGSSNTFHVTKSCYNDGPPCYYVARRTGEGGAYDPAPWPYVSDLGPKLDQYLFTGGAYIDNKTTQNRAYLFWTVLEVSGASHTLGYDSTNPALLRSTDGSGYLLTTNVSNPYYAGVCVQQETIYTPKGTQYSISLPPSCGGLTTVNMSIKDPDANTISIQNSQITDSLGRSLSLLPPSPTSSISGCPTISATYQSATSSSSWTVPGPNGAQQTYLFCYASVHYHTAFFGGCTSSCGTYTDTAGTISLLQSVVLPNGTYWAFIYDAANPSDNTSIGYGQVVQIREPTGGTISYQYGTNNTLCVPQQSTDKNYNRQVLTRTFNPGNGPLSTWTYGSGVVTDPLGNDVVTTFTTLGGCDAYETRQQTYQGSHSTGTLLQTKATSYQYVQGINNPQQYFNYNMATGVFPITVTTTLDNGQVTTTTYQYNDGGFLDIQPYCVGTSCNTAGVMSAQIPFGRTTATTTTDYGGATLKTVQTQYLYQQNSSYYPGNFLDQIASVTTLNGSGTQMAKTTYGYDENNGSPQGIFAHQTSVNRWLNTTNTNITAKTVYNTQGMVTQSIDPLLNATTFTYDSTGAFLSQVQYPTTSGVTHIEHFTIDPNTGLTTSHTDQNGQITSTQYDLMRRVTQVSYPDGGLTTYCYTDLGGPTCTQAPPPYAVVTTKKISSSASLTTTTVLDGLGRTSQTQLNSDPDCSTADKTDTTYDGLGRVYTVSNPYCSTTDPTYGLTTYVYDALGRATQVTHPDNSTILTTYTGRATQVQDEGNGTQRVTRISQVDGLGRLASLCEVASGPFVGSGGTSSSSLIGSTGTPAACGQDIAGTGFLTSYQYDILDNLLQVNQSGIAARTFTYDSLSRLLAASNPESGSISYAYDANGNLSTKTSPAPNQTGSGTVTITYQYDALNRLTQKSYNDTPTTPTASFIYDCCNGNYTNLVGRLYESTVGTGNLSATYSSYDTMGRIKYQQQNVPYAGGASVGYTLPYTYDLMGNMTFAGTGYCNCNIGYTYTYNSAARLTSLSNGTTYLSGAHYDAAGRLTSDTLGSAETESWTYSKRGWPVSSSVTLNSNTIYSYNITSFAPNGDILAANDSANGNWNYSYDQFNRLVCANLATNGTCATPPTGTPTYTYVYDRFGNRWQQNGSHSMQLSFTGNNPSNPQNNDRMDGYTYDAAGNLLNDGTHQYFYDAENHLIQVDGSSGYCGTGTGTAATACYFYDANGHRVRDTAVGGLSGGYGYTYDLSGRYVMVVSTASGGGPWGYEIYADWMKASAPRSE
jgi:YD repeat-containing protein